jgi:hypothetical protein
MHTIFEVNLNLDSAGKPAAHNLCIILLIGKKVLLVLKK